MYGVNDLNLILRDDVDHGAADAFKTCSEILATMAGDEDEGKIGVQITELPFQRRAGFRRSLEPGDGFDKGIDHRIAGKVNV